MKLIQWLFPDPNPPATTVAPPSEEHDLFISQLHVRADIAERRALEVIGQEACRQRDLAFPIARSLRVECHHE